MFIIFFLIPEFGCTEVIITFNGTGFICGGSVAGPDSSIVYHIYPNLSINADDIDLNNLPFMEKCYPSSGNGNINVDKDDDIVYKSDSLIMKYGKIDFIMNAKSSYGPFSALYFSTSKEDPNLKEKDDKSLFIAVIVMCCITGLVIILAPCVHLSCVKQRIGGSNPFPENNELSNQQTIPDEEKENHNTWFGDVKGNECENYLTDAEKKKYYDKRYADFFEKSHLHITGPKYLKRKIREKDDEIRKEKEKFYQNQKRQGESKYNASNYYNPGDDYGFTIQVMKG